MAGANGYGYRYEWREDGLYVYDVTFKEDGLGTAATVMICIAIVVIVAIILLAMYLFYRKKMNDSYEAIA